MVLRSAAPRKTNLLLNYVSNSTTLETKTETIVVSTMRSSTWKVATECSLMIELVVNMNTATDSTTLLMRSVKLANSWKTSNSSLPISKLNNLIF